MFFFLLDRWAWGPIHCLAHKKIAIYSRDETTYKCHFPGIARRVERIGTQLVYTDWWG